MSLSVRIIKVLKKLQGRVKARALKSSTKQLTRCAEQSDINLEIAEKRLQLAYEIQLQLEQRALTKLIESNQLNEAKRKELSELQEELEKL